MDANETQRLVTTYFRQREQEMLKAEGHNLLEEIRGQIERDSHMSAYLTAARARIKFDMWRVSELEWVELDGMRTQLDALESQINLEELFRNTHFQTFIEATIEEGKRDHEVS